MHLKRFKPLILFLLLLPLGLLAQAVKIPVLSALPKDLASQQIDLNGEWLFTNKPSASFWTAPKGLATDKIQVPGEWVMQGYEVEKGKAAGYYRTFAVPSNYKGRRVKLRSNGIFSDSKVYINGQHVGGHMGGFTPFELDITDAVRYGATNEITVSVRSESLADSLASASKYAYHTLGGITRDIFVFALSEVNISSFHAATDFDDKFEHAVLSAEVSLANESLKANSTLALKFTLMDQSGKVIPLKDATKTIASLSQNATQANTYAFDVASPKHWTAESPYLYTFTTELWDGKELLHSTSRRIGFREIEVKGNQFLVNGKPIKLRGVNRHEVMPLRGRSLEGNIWYEDTKLFKQGNVNYIRTSHYPPDEKLLEACDELGMFVEMEAPFCWSHQTPVKDEDLELLLVNQHVEMVNRDKSHASVVMWSLANESNLYKEYFKKSGEVIKQLDPTRPRIFSQWGPEADDGELEVTNHHYPGPTGPETYRNSKRPVTFDEYIHVNSYNRFELAADPGVRDMWGPLLDRMWTDMYNSRGVLGGGIWAGIDDTFFLPDGKIVGYGTWGPLDGWRREKPEFWGMKKSYSPVRIAQKGNLGADGKMKFAVENRHDFTDLKDVTITWKSGSRSGDAKVSLAPRKHGDFEIDFGQAAGLANDLYLMVTSADGYVLDEYTFVLKPTQKVEAKRSKSALKLTDSGEKLAFSNKAVFAEISKTDGLLRVMNAAGDTLLSSGANLMLLPLNSEGRGIQMTGTDQHFEPYNPVSEQWTATTVQAVQSADAITITVAGAYAEADGQYTYTLTNEGMLHVSYDFEVKKAVEPRQVGLVFDLPYSFTKLNWERTGYWNFYPKDHIAALKGEAIAFDPNIAISTSAGPGVKPSKAWAYDQTDAGSNLFRSTKQNIHYASLSNDQGNSVKVLSDGKQHFRSWKNDEQHRIKMLVADYNNAGKEGYLSSHAEADYKPLKRGDRVQGSIVLDLTASKI